MEARELYERLGDRDFAARATQQAGHLALALGDAAGARSLILTSLGTYRDLAEVGGVAESLEGLSAWDAADGKVERAACIAAAAEAIRERLATRPLPFDRAFTDRYVSQARISADDDVWRTSTENGRAVTLDQAVEYCLSQGSKGRGAP